MNSADVHFPSWQIVDCHIALDFVSIFHRHSLSLSSLFFLLSFSSFLFLNLYLYRPLFLRSNSIGKVISSNSLSNTTNQLAPLSLNPGRRREKGLERERVKKKLIGETAEEFHLCDHSLLSFRCCLSRSLLTFPLIPKNSLLYALRTWRATDQLHTNIELSLSICSHPVISNYITFFAVARQRRPNPTFHVRR